MADDKNFENKTAADLGAKSDDGKAADGSGGGGSSSGKDDSKAAESGQSLILINFRTSGKDKEIAVDENSSIDDVRNKIAGEFEADAEDIKLIFAGRIMKGHETLKGNDVKENYVVHLVIKKRAATGANVSPGANSSRQGAAAPAPGTSPADDVFSFLGGTFPHFQDGAQAGNLNNLTDLFRIPALQNLFSDPSRVRDLLMVHPQVQALIERQPMVGHILRNPEIFRQTFEIARSPAMMQELLRNQDRAMSNLESVPGGYSALQRMYHDIQEPMMDMAANPLASLLYDPATGNTPRSAASGSPVNPQQGTENREPLPNPWQHPQGTPEHRQETDALASFLRAVVQANPSPNVPPSVPPQSTADAGASGGSNSGTSSFLGDVLRMFDTLNTQSDSSAASSSVTSAARGPIGGGSVTGAAAATSSSTTGADSNPIDYELTYRHQLSKLEEMGFFSRSENLQALIATNGNINAAIERLLTNIP